VVLSVKELRKDFGSTHAVRGVSFSVERGEIFGLLGPNGAGKTTTISMIAGVLAPSAGSASICGHDILVSPYAARRELGFVPQELALYEELSARDNLRFFASLYDVPRSELDEAIEWALRAGGLVDRADRAVRTFSGGMKRRLNLVAGLVHRPRLLVLDEPSVGVDPQSRKFLFDTIRTLASEHGMAILYTSHYMEEVELLCPRIAIIDHGELVAQGSVATLIDEHATETVSVEYRGDSSSLTVAFSALPEVQVDPGCVRFPRSLSLSEVAAVMEGAGVQVVRVEAGGASLEAVFLSLTGHSLRDGP